jgi:signal transduction histidine kinase
VTPRNAEDGERLARALGHHLRNVQGGLQLLLRRLAATPELGESLRQQCGLAEESLAALAGVGTRLAMAIGEAPMPEPEDSPDTAALVAAGWAADDPRLPALAVTLGELWANAMAAGDAAPELTVDADGQGWRLADRGPGLPPDLPVAPPVLCHPAGRFGLGLGLTIAVRYADRAGATLTLGDREGGGVTAQVRLRSATR